MATVIAEADKVIRVDDHRPWLLHIEFQASYDPALGLRLLFYSVALRRRHGLPVRSVVVLLRPEADGPELTGQLEEQLPDGDTYLAFRYRAVRVWQQPVEAVLAGGLATLPLAPLAAGAEVALPGVIRRMGERLARETTPEAAALLWTSTYLLMGLRYPHDVAGELLRGVHVMRESSTYQAILAEGEAAEARKLLLRLGEERFGPPDRGTRAALEQLTDLDRLEQLTVGVLHAASWDDLLAKP